MPQSAQMVGFAAARFIRNSAGTDKENPHGALHAGSPVWLDWYSAAERPISAKGSSAKRFADAGKVITHIRRRR